MTKEINPNSLNPLSGVIRVRTLCRLRWAAVCGQSVAIWVAWAFLGAAPDMRLTLPIIAGLALSNLVLTRLRRGRARLTGPEAACWLLGDLLQLSLLLGVSGGLVNPFAMMLLAPVAIGASVLPRGATALLCGAALLGASALWLCAAPIPMQRGPALNAPPLMLTGVWAALCISVLFITICARQIARDARRLTGALSTARLALSREQRVAALGALSAATAHELGTPLATIKMIAGELARHTTRDDPEMREDIALLREQTARCEQILQTLRSHEPEGRAPDAAPVFALIREAAAPHISADKRLELRLDGRRSRADDPKQPLIQRSPELLHALRNVIQNAFDFADRRICVEVLRGPETLSLSVRDDGPGFQPGVLKELGEPFVTTRNRPAAGDGGYGGLGLGLFISKTLLEGLGAQIDFANAPRGGAVVTARWPRNLIERRAARAPD